MTSLEAANHSAVKAFRNAADAWLERTCELFPEQASRMGFKEFEPLLGENSVAVRKEHVALLELTLDAVEKLPEAAFRGDDWLDRRGFLSRLRTDLFFARDIARWRTNPQVHCDAAADAIFDLLIRSSGQTARVLPAIEARLKKIPEFLAAGAGCLHLPVPRWIELAEHACAGSAEFLGGLVRELTKVSPHPSRTASLLRDAAAAFTEYARAIRRKKPGAPSSFAIGRERFEFLIRERLGLDLTLPEACAAGENLIAQHEFLLHQAAAKLGGKSARILIKEAADSWQPAGTLLDAYRATTREIKSKLAEIDLVTLPPGESLKVLPVPAFLRHQFPNAAYNPPPPFSKKQTGIFWVNDMSLSESDPQKKRAEILQHFGHELTSVHEAYPGHHLQFVAQFRHPSRIRRICEHSIFYEGWTMWCEKLAVENSLVTSPHAHLIQLHDALWRAHRIVIDCGLQAGTMSPADAARRLSKGVGFTPTRAAGDINWYTASPTVPMSYLLGRLEVEKLYRNLVVGDGWTMRQFNDWMLSHGSLPWSWIWRAKLET